MKKTETKQVNDILKALDTTEKQDAPLALQYRLANYSFEEQKPTPSLVWKYALASCILIFLALNIGVIKIYKQKQEEKNAYQTIVNDYEIGQTMLEKSENYE